MGESLVEEWPCNPPSISATDSFEETIYWDVFVLAEEKFKVGSSGKSPGYDKEEMFVVV